MFNVLASPVPSAAAYGAPATGIFPVSPELAWGVVVGFMIVATAALWMLGELTKQRTHQQHGPSEYRKAA